MPLGDLKPQDFQTATWAKLRQHYQARLDVLRRRNDNNLSPEETAMIRGQIVECKHILALEEAPGKPEARPPDLAIGA